MADMTPTVPWTAFAKYAGVNHYFSGGRELDNQSTFFAIHCRIGSVWGEAALPDQVTITLTHSIDKEAEAEADERFIRIWNAAQRRITGKPLGLLLRIYGWPTGGEIVFRCTDAALAVERLQPLVQDVPGSTLTTLHDRDWKEPFEHAERGMYLERLQEVIASAPKVPAPPPRKDHPATTSTRAFRSWVRRYPPRCLDGLHLEWVDKPIKAMNELAAAFDVRHKQGSQCRIYRHSVDGHTIGPVHLSWREEQNSTPTEPALCFDSSVHGYDAEAEPKGTSTHKRGDGIGSPVPCPKCGHEWHLPRFIFDYSSTSDHADEPHDFPVQNFFDAITIEARCANCARKHRAFMMVEV